MSLKKSPSGVYIPTLATASVSQGSSNESLSPQSSSRGDKSPKKSAPKSARGKEKDKELKKRKDDELSPRDDKVDLDRLISPTASAGGDGAKNLQKALLILETYRLLDIVIRGLGLQNADVAAVVQFAEAKVLEAKAVPPPLRQLRMFLTSASALTAKTVRYVDELMATLKIQRSFRGYLLRNRMVKLEKLYSGVNWSARLDHFRALVADEEAYGQRLDLLVQGYMHPLSEKILAKDELASIFRNADKLYQSHLAMMEGLKAERATVPHFTNLGWFWLDVVVKRLVDYGEFVENSQHAVTTIYRLSDSNEKFRAFLNKRFKQDNLPPIDDLLAAPIPRLSSYTKKLKAILKETPDKHPDYEDLNQAFNLTRKIKQQVKAKLATAKNRDKILEAKRRTTSVVPGVEIDVDGRQFVKEGPGNIVDAKKEKKPRTILLFSDAIMIAKSEKKESLDMKQFVRFHPSTNVMTDSEGAFKMAKAGKDKDCKIDIFDTANTAGPDCLTLNFKSSEEHDEWLGLIRQQIEKLKISKAVIFGAPVVEMLKKAVDPSHLKAFDLSAPMKKQKDKITSPSLLNELIPPFFRLLTSTLEEDLMVTGLFRVSAADHEIRELRSMLDTATPPEHLDDIAPHVVADVLKVFLRQLPEPLLTYEVYDTVINQTQKYEKGQEGAYASTIKELIQSLPLANFILTRALARHLFLVEHFAKYNLMTAMNLAIVFGPTILAPRVDSIEASLLMPRLYYVVLVLISHYDLIFEEDPPAVSDELVYTNQSPESSRDGATSRADKSDGEEPSNKADTADKAGDKTDVEKKEKAKRQRPGLNPADLKVRVVRSGTLAVDPGVLEKLFKRMSSSSNGVEVKDRKLLFKTFKNAFSGTECVDWMLSHNEAKNRTEAVKLGQQLVALGFILPITFQDKVFKDSSDLYGFDFNEPPKPSKGSTSRTASVNLETISEDGKSSTKSASLKKKGFVSSLFSPRDGEDNDHVDSKPRMRNSKSSGVISSTSSSLLSSEESHDKPGGSASLTRSGEGVKKSKSARHAVI